MTKDIKVRTPCMNCDRETNHLILHQTIEGPTDDYNYTNAHQIIECLGCESRSFRVAFTDYENSYPVSDEEWDIPENVTIFPKFVKDIVKLEIYEAPDIVREIYNETLIAITEGALILAGLGLRGTIEAVCNDQSISGRTLDTRISKLATQGMISSNDAKRLHAIRFLGNDAAHEIKKPTQSQISVAFKIINHLLQSIYLLDLESQGRLETIVTKIDDFITILDKGIKRHKIGDELPLAAIIGKDVRRIDGAMTQMEHELMQKISNEEYQKLKIGKLEKYANSPNKVQHFILI